MQIQSIFCITKEARWLTLRGFGGVDLWVYSWYGGNNIYITGKIVWFEKLTDNLSRPYPSWDRLSTNMCWISRRKWMDEWFEEFKILLKGAERHLWKRNATNRQSSCLLHEDLLAFMLFWFMYHGIFINMCLIHIHTHTHTWMRTCTHMQITVLIGW